MRGPTAASASSGVEVQRPAVDVAEDRNGVLVHDAIRRRHEAERGGQDLVAGANAGRPHREMETAGAARHRGGLVGPEPVREGTLESL